MSSDRLTIIMTSCKWYDDVLDIHEKLQKIHWKDCPYQRILVMDEVTEDADYLKDFDKVLITGKESGPQNHVRITEALKQVITPYVIFLQEDMLLYDKVDTGRFEYFMDVMEKDEIGCIRMLPFLGADKDYSVPYAANEEFIEFPKGTPYRVSYTPSIWKKDFLFNISEQYLYGADFERKGSDYSNSMDEKILGYKYVAYPYINGILRGKWEIPAVRMIAYYKIMPDFSRHKLMDSKDLFKQSLMAYIYNLNPKFILKIQNRSKIGKKY